jgi:hypothetical protein
MKDKYMEWKLREDELDREELMKKEKVYFKIFEKKTNSKIILTKTCFFFFRLILQYYLNQRLIKSI